MKQLCIFLLLLLTLPSFADTFVVDGIKYGTNSDGKTVYVTSNNPKYEGDIVIPASVTYEGKTYGVTSIGNSAFYDCRGLTSINIPDGVTSIGNYAFYGCSGLTSITIPDGVTSIGYEAFRGCSGLTSITIPDGVTSIGTGAFRSCSSLTSINIPDGVTSIGEFAFYECRGLTRVDYGGTIADWLKINFGYSSNPLFYAHHLYIDGKEVTEVVVPDGVTSIGDYAFDGCSSLTSITIPDGVTSIGESAFSGCSNLTSITIPDGVTSIEGYAFLGCSGLTSITIPDGVTSIGESAFYGCSGLTSINIPDGVTSIGRSAFYDCSGLTSINIPDGVTSIGGWAFYNCSGLTSITIPESVTSIGESAFRNCSGLTSINIPDGVTSIGDYAFEYCSGLTSITIPDGVTSIGDRAFYGCSSLTSITIPDGVTSIGDYAFSWCSGLTSINIPDGVTSIGDEAFRGCRGLTSINIPDGVTSIGDAAFQYCSGLKQVATENANVSMIKSALGTDKTYIVPCTLYEQYVAAGLTAKRADMMKKEATSATCTADGNSEYYTCPCGKYYRDEFGATEIENGSWVIAAHHLSVVTDNAVAATCTEAGLTEGSHCEACHVTLVAQETIAALGHEWGSWSTTKEATCVEKGSKQRVCAHDASHVDEADIAINSNNHTNVVTDEAVAATCTETGLTEGSHCEACHATVVAQETIAALGHEWGSWTTTKEATCVEKGKKQRVCAHDASHVDVADIAINSNNHTNVVTDNAVAATCTETGLTEGSHCEACHVTLVAQETIAALGHEWGSWKTTKAATCVAKGKKQRVCAHDASHVDEADIAINSNNHTNIVTDNAVAATCIEAGLTEGSHCEACHVTIVAQETTEAIGHLFTDYIYNNDATTEADGTETAHCDHNCGTTDTHTAEGTKIIPTGVRQVSGNGQKVIKTIENGRVVVIRDGKKYDIMGREL